MPEPASQRIPILTLSLEGHLYALLIEDVLEVNAMVELMPIKDAPAEILGVANRHGTALLILDLRQVMGYATRPIDSATLFVVVSCNGQQMGLVVDEVYQVEYIDSAQLEATNKAGKLIRGIISYKTELMQIINPVPLLTTYLSEEGNLEI